MNHYPLIGRKMYADCVPLGGTVKPLDSITCPKCRDRISLQVEKKRAGAFHFKDGSQERAFFLANAANLAKILDQ